MTQTIAAALPTHFMGYKAIAADSTMTLREVVADADMDYGVDKVQSTYEWDGKKRIAANQFELCRTDNGNNLSTQTVTKTYKVLTPNDIADDFQFFIDGGYASPFAAFTTGTGIETIALALNPDLFQGINGYTGFILGQNRQGNVGAKGSLFIWRKICANGMMGWSKTGSFSISHRGKVRQKFTDHTREWAKIEKTFQDMNARMTELSGVPMTYEQFAQATDLLHGTRVEGDTVYDVKTNEEASTRKLNIRAEILLATDMPDMGTYGATAADFYNAVTYRLSHRRDGSTRSQTTQADSLLSGAARTEEFLSLSILNSFLKTGQVA